MRQHCDAPPTLVLLFGGGKLEPEVLLETLNQTLPGVPVIGGSAAGVIATSALGCTGLEVGMVAFFDPAVTPKVHATYELLESDYEAGRQLGMSARGTHAPASAVLLFYDSVRAFQPRQLHLAGSVLDGFRSGWQREALVIGGGLLTDLNLSDGWMLLDGSVRRHAAAGHCHVGQLWLERTRQAKLAACRPSPPPTPATVSRPRSSSMLSGSTTCSA
ncbi:FIST N-terminal domain-containing protein [Roseomonas mucosa]|uniref:FIST N-terminal domain-containing protein n=1 Tax=Roseomonas mucosa TaxID=207340 RepID=UPI00223F376F|nr:FIST N-terminal domain-containing protein [Roseomonas mucosa]